MSFEEYILKIEKESNRRIKDLHHLAKKMWGRAKLSPIDVRNLCLDAWDGMKHDLGSDIVPLIPVHENRPATNLIFGSGSFSTGGFQAQQFAEVKDYLENPPVVLQGIVANKSEVNGCNGQKIAKKNGIAGIVLDFTDWYHEFIDSKEKNPIRATRYWYPPDDESDNKPSPSEIAKRFRIRQDQFHKSLGEKIATTVDLTTDIVSARGYNFQFCSNLFAHQKNALPHINDTHPADLSYIDLDTHIKLYAGWQAGAVELMVNDGLNHLRGSLIEVNYMDGVNQIKELDEGVLMALGQGIKPPSPRTFSAKKLQEAMKVSDDNWFCTLEPTGLILTWGITKKPVPIVYRDVRGNPVIAKQRAVVVGNRIYGGVSAFGADLEKQLKDLEQFLIGK